MRQPTIALLVLMMALLMACQRVDPVTPTANELPEFLLLYSRQGGIAGFCDTLTVRVDEAILEGCRGEVVTIPLEPALQAELTQLVQQYAPFETNEEDNPGGPDNMTQYLRFNGVGQEEAGEEARATLYRLAGELISNARAP